MEREIVLDDLANPQFTPEAAALIDTVEGMGAQVDLDLDALESAAAAQVGAEDFGAPLYREPLGVLGEAITEESGMSPLGLLSAQSQAFR